MTGSCTNDQVARADADGRRVRDVMVSRPKTVPADGSVADLRRLFENPHVQTALLVDGPLFAGAVERGELSGEEPADQPAAAVARRDVETIGPDAPMAEAMARLDANADHRLIVLDPDGRTLRGLLCLTRDRNGFCQSG